MNVLFVLIFFVLILTTKFVKISEISSTVASSSIDSNDKKALALTLKINEDSLSLLSGTPSTLIKKIPKLPTGQYDLAELRNLLFKIKESNSTESTIILHPETELDFDQLVKIMDHVRTDNLFNKIIFGGIGS